MKKIYSIALLALAVVGLSSCLKDEYLYDYDDQQSVIEFMIPTGNTTGVTVTASKIATKDFYVNYSIAEWQNIKEDITVTLALDQSLAKGTILPTAAYTLSTESAAKSASALSLPMEVVIPAASKQDTSVRVDWNNHRNAKGTLTISNPDALEKGVTYYLPLRIQTVSPQVAPISGNFGYEIITVTKNY